MTRYLSLAEGFWLAEQVTGTPASVLLEASRGDLADSALHAPPAGHGHEDFYPDLIDKAAVPTCRVARNTSAARRKQARRVGSARDVHRPERMSLAT